MRRQQWIWVVLFLVLVGGTGSQADEDPTARRDANAASKALAETMGVLRARMEARLNEGEVLSRLGRMEEALVALRSVEKIYEEGLAELRALLAGRTEPRPPPRPADTGTIGAGSGVGGAFRGRGGGRAQGTGGRNKFDHAVDDALGWLAAHQSPNGGWEAAGFNQWCDGKPISDVSKRPDGLGKALYDPGVTGLAVCAFLGAGYTNRGNHPFAKVVSRGLRYLKNIQGPEGCFGPRSTQQYIYNHATSALAMVEAYGMTGSPIFKHSAQRCLDFIALARNPCFAWRYGIQPGDNDTSVSGWMMMALKSAQLINKDAVKRGKPPPLTIDESAFDGLRAWLEKVTDMDNGRVGYVMRGTGPTRPQDLVDRFPGEKSESMTSVGMLARTFMGEDPRKSKIIKLGAELCAKLPPTWNPMDGSIDMYYWYYATLAMFQVGGKYWDIWKKGMQKAMVETQRKDGDYCQYKGSWDPIGPWGLDGGRVYSTAILALCLEVFYRYDRVFGAESCGEHGGRGDALTPAWIDPALLSLPIELPHVAEIEGDERSSMPAADETWRSVAIQADGTVLGLETADGTPRPSWELGADNPGAQDDAIQELTRNLVEATTSPELRFPDGSSRVRMLIYADWRTKWKYVQWTMQACAHPSVKIFRLSFALRRAGESSPLARFDSNLPKDRGLAPTPVFPEDLLKVKVKLFRRSMGDKDKAYTMVKIDNDRKQYHMPKAWCGRTKESQARIDQYDRIFRAIETQVMKKMLAYGGKAEEVQGEIIAPPPKGGAVPHGDVMEVLGVLRRVGITNVIHEGAATPLTSSERALRRATGK